MNKANVQNTPGTSEIITQLHPDIQLNLGNYKRQQARPGMDIRDGEWKQKLDAVLRTWGKLSEEEILSTEGHEQKLTSLIQERYAITRGAANQQVKKFLGKVCC